MTAINPPARARVPASTYRLQLSAAFTLQDAVDRVPSLHELGVTHLYLSPLLQASSGSPHGYDVVDHGRIDAARGGEDGLRALAETAHARGMGLVLDIVPNHMSVAVPAENRAWWDVLRFGRASTFASWFDIDWQAGPILLPVLASPADAAQLAVVPGEDGPELAYGDLRYPLTPGSAGGSVEEVVARQAFRLVDWRRGNAELTYRRFFDVTSLAGLRIEDPDVYAATHALALRLVAEGVLDGLRVDHPDGLADPGGYLAALARDTGDAWVVVEKILEAGEHLPKDWATAGTTGYDAARLVTGTFVDPDGEAPLRALWHRFGGSPQPFHDRVLDAKREVTQRVLRAEVARLERLASTVDANDLAEVLVHFPVYRSYLPADGAAHLDAALHAAKAPEALARRLRDAADPLAIRFQQTSGMVMAKGVEDTAFYRDHTLLALNEVGADPGRFGVPTAEFHAESAALQAQWPRTMTLLSSHDTKRSEDVRARLALLAEVPHDWAAVVAALEEAATRISDAGRAVDASTRYLLHQTAVGLGRLDAGRLGRYLEKATREAKLHTSWTEPDQGYDRAVQELVRAVCSDSRYAHILADFVDRLDGPWRRTVLAQKLLQLTMPGIPDVYQGAERTVLSLVDPDNRRPVPPDAAPDEKTALVRTVLRLRRESPELFEGYGAVELDTPRALAFQRSPALIVVVARRAVALEREGWGTAKLPLPPGTWRDLLSDRRATTSRLADVVGDRPGALLRRTG